jgi:hypothetical protein
MNAQFCSFKTTSSNSTDIATQGKPTNSLMKTKSQSLGKIVFVLCRADPSRVEKEFQVSADECPKVFRSLLINTNMIRLKGYLKK